MREIKEMREVTVAYEANDGQRFSSEELCRKHEETCRDKIFSDFLSVCCKTGMTEVEVFEDFGGGSSEYDYVVIYPQNEEDIQKVNNYINSLPSSERVNEFTANNIGEKYLIYLGYDAMERPYDRSFYNEGTYEEICKRFAEHMKGIYSNESEEKK